MSIKDQIKNAVDIKTIAVECPEWETTVYVKSISTYDKEQWVLNRTKQIETNTVGNLATSLLVKCCCDEEGNLIFSDEDMEWLSKKNGKAIDRLFQIASDLIFASQKEITDLLKKK